MPRIVGPDMGGMVSAPLSINQNPSLNATDTGGLPALVYPNQFMDTGGFQAMPWPRQGGFNSAKVPNLTTSSTTANWTLTNNDRTASLTVALGAGNTSNLISNIARQDKRYFEVFLDRIDSQSTISIGCCIGDQHNSGYLNNGAGVRLGFDKLSFGYLSTAGATGVINHDGGVGLTTGVPICSTNDVMMMAFDMVAGKCWFGRNGTWMLSGDPANGLNPTIGLGGATPSTYLSEAGVLGSTNWWYACIGTDMSNSSGGPKTQTATGHFTPQECTYTPPAGFSCWDDDIQNIGSSVVATIGAHRAWRVNGSSAGTIVSMFEVEFRTIANVGGTGIYQTATGGTPLSTSDFAGLPKANAFNGNLAGTRWASNTANPAFIGYDFGAGAVHACRECAISWGGGSNQDMVSGITIEWSDDLVTWTVAKTVGAMLPPVTGVFNLFLLPA